GIVSGLVPALLRPAPSGTTVRLGPRGTSATSRTASVDRKKPTSDDAVAAVTPWFLMVFATEILPPGATVVGVTVAAVTTRSGPRTTGPLTPVLLFSSSSATWLSGSATTRIR